MRILCERTQNPGNGGEAAKNDRKMYYAHEASPSLEGIRNAHESATMQVARESGSV